MSPSPLRRTQELGAAFWNDSCDLRELRHAVQAGATGATSNPVLVAQAVEAAPETWNPVLDRLLAEHPTAREDELVWLLVAAVARQAAGVLLPVHERSGGRDGFLCVQTDPRAYRDAARMVAQAQGFMAYGPNVAVKVPAVGAGLRAIEELAALGIRTNATVCFSLPQAIACAEAAERGLDRARRAGRSVDGVRPWVTIMVGRLDDHLKRVQARDGGAVAPEVLDRAGIAVFKRAHALFHDRGYRSLLLAAAYRHTGHWSELIGPDVVLSMPYRFWNEFEASDIEPRASVHEAVDPAALAALTAAFADFRAAYEPDGLAAGAFASYGPTVHTLQQFLAGFDRVVSLVRARLLG